jgi:voltage-gated potassium channel
VELQRWDDKARPAIILAALLPIIASVTAGPREGILIIVDFAGWAVFVVDLVVHMRYQRKYLRTGLGLFDLSVVILTFPWYIIPGLESADVILLARVARVARLFISGSHLGPFRRLAERIGRAAFYASMLLVVCALVLDKVEHGQHDFDNFGDSMWFSIVTLTTVGYGDVVPESTAGRLVAVVLMVGGVALLGALAGSLGAFLRVQDTGGDVESDILAVAAADPQAAAAAELAALREQVVELNRRLLLMQAHLGVPDPHAAVTPTPDDDAGADRDGTGARPDD